jgi:uncharacterized alkaline shock family protein YloU
MKYIKKFKESVDIDNEVINTIEDISLELSDNNCDVKIEEKDDKINIDIHSEYNIDIEELLETISRIDYYIFNYSDLILSNISLYLSYYDRNKKYSKIENFKGSRMKLTNNEGSNCLTYFKSYINRLDDKYKVVGLNLIIDTKL